MVCLWGYRMRQTWRTVPTPVGPTQTGLTRGTKVSIKAAWRVKNEEGSKHRRRRVAGNVSDRHSLSNHVLRTSCIEEGVQPCVLLSSFIFSIIHDMPHLTLYLGYSSIAAWWSLRWAFQFAKSPIHKLMQIIRERPRLTLDTTSFVAHKTPSNNRSAGK